MRNIAGKFLALAPEETVRSPAPASMPVVAKAPPSRFELAAEAAMARFTNAEWALMEPTKRTDAIYTELRRLDAESHRKQDPDRLR